MNQVEKGVIGYITNHSYLDNPTFRGMRQDLMKSFDEIYVLDLHGNALKKEKCPDGSKDENVFDIRQGVAIAFFVKKKGSGSDDGCKVFHYERWGLREKKYEWLFSHDKNTTEWEEIHPHSSFYFFVPKEEKYEELYNKHWKITDIFSVKSVGIVTARDRLTIQNTPDKVWEVVQDFSSLPEEKARTKYNLGQDARDWKVSFAQNDLRKTGLKKELILPILYRPFDVRYTYYTGHSRGFICMPRPEVMRHMMKENLAMCVGRAGQVVGLEKPWNIVFCSEFIADFNLFYRGGNVNFPLYLYGSKDREANINKILWKDLESAYSNSPSPEEIFYYIYSILHSNIYRIKYAEFLKTDFPRIPFATNYDLFIKMGKLGKKLVDLHLLKSELLSHPIAKFQGKADNIVEKPVYNEEEGRFYINKTQYFEGVKQDVWEYPIGGYQVLSKWTKYRRGRKLSLADIKHYCKVVTALKKTIEIQDEIDKLYTDAEKDILEFRENNEQNASLEKYAK